MQPLAQSSMPPSSSLSKWMTSLSKITLILCCALLLQGSTENYLLNIVITTHENKKMTLQQFIKQQFIKQQFIKQQRKDSASNQRLLINFWATWCAPCIKELPSLIQLEQRQSETGIKVIAIAVTETPENVSAFLGKNNIQLNFPVVYDPTANSFKKNIKLLPTSYLMSKKGVIVEKFVGDKDWQNVFK